MRLKWFALILGLFGLSQATAWSEEERSALRARLGAPIAVETVAPVSALGTRQPAPIIEPVRIANQRSNRFYGQAEYLLWWLRGVNTPVLATADDNLVGIPPGVLGGPETRILLGGDNLSTHVRQGGRFTIGHWMDSEQAWGIEGNFFIAPGGSRSVGATSPGDNDFGTPTVFRPHFDVLLGQDSALFVAGPFTPGGMNVTARQELYGAEANLRRAMSTRGNLSIDVLAGFRFLALDESLDISTLSVGSGAVPTLATEESFAARNRFYGGQLGADVIYRVNNALALRFTPKVALGGSQQTVNINGNAVTTDATTGAILASGPATLLAQTTNIGQHRRDQFCFVPEIGVQMGYQLSRNVSVTAGYTWLYMTNVARPGDAIDRNTTVPTIGLPPGSATNPGVNWQTGNFWAQGIDLGIVVRY